MLRKLHCSIIPSYLLTPTSSAKRWSRLKTKYETEHNFKFAGFAGKKGEAKAATETGEGEDGTESPKKTPTKKLPATQLPAKKTPTKKRKVDDTVKEEGEEAREQEVVKKEDEEVSYLPRRRSVVMMLISLCRSGSRIFLVQPTATRCCRRASAAEAIGYRGAVSFRC